MSGRICGAVSPPPSPSRGQTDINCVLSPNYGKHAFHLRLLRYNGFDKKSHDTDRCTELLFRVDMVE